MYDVVIIGAGPAGLTAAIYAARKNLSTLVLSSDIGGQVELTGDVENYPGFTFLTGPDLIKKFQEHVKKYNVELDSRVVVREIIRDTNSFIIKTNSRTHEAKSIIIASRRIKRELNVPGEKELQNKGVSCMLRYDLNTFKNRDVAVIGAGNSAMNVVFQLVPIADRIYVINCTDRPNADEISLNRIKDHPKVLIMNNTIASEIRGKDWVEKIIIKHADSNKEEALDVQGIFVEIGYVASTDFLKGLIHMNEKDEIIIDIHNSTNVPGIFAAGDVTNVLEKQIIVACGEGAKAALSAYEYLKKNDLIIRE